MTVQMDVVAPALPGFWQRLGQRLQLAWQDWRADRTLRRELAELESVHQLGATLEDIGLTRSQLPGVIRGVARQHRLFRRMVARRGLERRRFADRGSFNEALWTCTVCHAGSRCRSWLDSGQTEGSEAFCPNAATFKQLAANQSASPPAR